MVKQKVFLHPPAPAHLLQRDVFYSIFKVLYNVAFVLNLQQSMEINLEGLQLQISQLVEEKSNMEFQLKMFLLLLMLKTPLRTMFNL